MGSDLRPALAGSVVLHLLVLALGLIAFPQTVRKVVPSVPVTIVSRAPVTDIRPAVEAPETVEATVETPIESPQLAAPEPVPDVPPPPTPAPPKPPPPTPAPTPPKTAPPKPAPPKPAPPKPAPAPPKPALDLDALASKMSPKAQPRKPALDLNALASKMPARQGAGRQGPNRPETAPEAREAVGAAQGLSADEASLLAAKLARLWRPNCAAESAANIQVRVNIRLTPAGALASPPTIVGGQPNNPVWLASSTRALAAVAQGAPYTELRRERYAQWKDITFTFDARQVCLGL